MCTRIIDGKKSITTVQELKEYTGGRVVYEGYLEFDPSEELEGDECLCVVDIHETLRDYQYSYDPGWDEYYINSVKISTDLAGAIYSTLLKDLRIKPNQAMDNILLFGEDAVQ